VPGAEPNPKRTRALSRDRVIRTAAQLADADGLSALTMRSLASTLSVKPMSLYNHIRGKEDLLDGMVDFVFAQIDLPDTAGPWRLELRGRGVSIRAVLARHPWALTLMDSRSSPGPATLAHHDAVVGVLLNSGCSPAVAARAYTVVDAYIYGFVLQEAAMPDMEPEAAVDAAIGSTAEAYPHLMALAEGHLLRPGYSFADEFEPGLDLVLDAVEALMGRKGLS
jgi:AcrR family transcriptional regulator